MTPMTFIYLTLKRLARMVGYTLELAKIRTGSSYETILPAATYAPWLRDEEFLQAYKNIQSYTLVDQYRCYELWQLVEQSTKVAGALIEIGVWRGGTGALIAKKANLVGSTSSVYLCDTFAGVAHAGENDTYYKGGEHADTSVSTVRNVLKKVQAKNTKILVGIFPEESGNKVTDKRFRFCHIDVDVYISAKNILAWIWPKLSVGGIVVFDDYGFYGCEGVTQLVNEVCDKKDRVFVHNLNGHAIFIKTR